jgi:N-acetylneuraminic acid mutarotase
MFRTMTQTMPCRLERNFKPILFCFASLLVLSASAISQANEWTWQGGGNSCCQPGDYGTQGTSAAGNIPSARLQPATATDSQGNFWLFGGGGVNATLLNDLWRFDTSIQQWVWVSGSNTGTEPGVWGTLGTPASGNIPSPRENAVSWIDSSGNYWMFGGNGLDSQGNVGLMNDLWEYTPSTNQWTWMAGYSAMTCSLNILNKIECVQPANNGTMGQFAATNTPGGRDGEVIWTDTQGNFWLFGGQSYDGAEVGGNFNDFWEFNLTSKQWAWMGGVSAIDCVNPPPEGFCLGSESPQPQYGTLGVAAAGNNPGGRNQAVGWIDSNGDLWIFGGINPIFTGPLNDFLANFDDVWKFSFSSNEWTWMAGNNSAATSTSNFPGVYGTLGTAAAANVPGSRVNETSWTDRSGNFWIFGGSGYDSAGNNGFLNDLWMFNPTTLNWTWMGGSTTVGSVCPQGYCGQPAIYGTLATAAAGNDPGGRAAAAGWTDSTGDFWLFGGGISQVDIVYNDLWEYHPSANTLPAAITPAFNPPAGTYTSAQNVTISNGMANASIHYTTNGSTPTSNSTLYTAPVSVSATETIQALAIAGGYPSSGVAIAAYAITPPAATPTFSEPGGTYTAIQTVSLSATTPNATIYYTTDGSTPTTASTAYSSAITVSSTETIQAIATATGYVASAVASATYTIALPPDFSLAPISPSTLTVEHGQSGNATVSVSPLNGFSSSVSFTCSGLPAGAACSFSPPTVTPSGNAASTTLTISTASARASLAYFHIPGFALMLTLCAFGWRRKSKARRRMRPLFAGCILGLLVLAGCSGSSSSPFTEITSTVTVTASSGSLQHTTTLTLVID